ncbi:MAG TPA: hypothetical protein VJ807_01285 [Gaiellaceae bacterium]|nr:hypothetical protein [Gaiellaceae bacterium]
MYVAGVQIRAEGVRKLARLVEEPTRSLLLKSLALDGDVVPLAIEDPQRVLEALDEVRTEALAELRGVLLSEHEWRTGRGSSHEPR